MAQNKQTIIFPLRKYSIDNAGAEKAQYLISKEKIATRKYNVIIYCQSIDKNIHDELMSDLDVVIIVEPKYYYAKLFIELFKHRKVIFYSWLWKYNFIYGSLVNIMGGKNTCFNHGFVDRELKIKYNNKIFIWISMQLYKYTLTKICNEIYVPSKDLLKNITSISPIIKTKIQLYYIKMPDTVSNNSVSVRINDNKKILYIGGFNKYKGIFKLLECAEINRAHTFYVYGSTNTKYKAHVLGYIRKLKLDNIKIMGEFTNNDRIYSKYKILYYPTLLDNLPLSIIEALMHGMNIYTTKEGELKYIFKDGVNGYFISSSARNIKTYSKNIGINARKTYLRYFAQNNT